LKFPTDEVKKFLKLVSNARDLFLDSRGHNMGHQFLITS